MKRAWAGLLIWAIAVIALLLTPRSLPALLTVTTVLACTGMWYARRLPLGVVLAAGMLVRIVAVGLPPLLSDDIYRFLWDGQLWWAGYHPLDFVPSAAPTSFAERHPSLLTLMNSPGYFTVYPPGSQLCFALAAAVSSSIAAGTIALKAQLLLGELAVLYLLSRLDEHPGQLGLRTYALFPLVIVEVCGNAHFESLALAGLLLAVFGFRQNRPILSGVGLGLGVLVKLVPALAGPALLGAWLYRGKAGGAHSLSWGAAVRFSVAAGATVLGGLATFLLPSDLTGFGESLDLYFRTFEFNGSLYTLASAIGEWIQGYNWIAVVGPTLGIVALVGILLLAVVGSRKRKPLVVVLLWSFAVYLACATTVHPWYAIYLLGLGVLTPYRWPLLLGASVVLSYFAYQQANVHVPTWALGLEYMPVVALGWWEGRRRLSRSASASLAP